MASIIAKSSGTPRELIPANNYVARCIGMIHIGTIEEVIQGQVKKLDKVRITWELPYELKTFDKDKGEQPLVFSSEFTLSLSDKANLRKMLESWRGKPFTAEEAESFDITKLIGKTCMLNIIHEASKKDPTRIFEKLSSIAAVPKGTTVPAQINPTRILSYDDFDFDYFNSLPDFIKEKMQKSDQYKAMMEAKKTPPPVEAKAPAVTDAEVISDDDDDLPF